MAKFSKHNNPSKKKRRKSSGDKAFAQLNAYIVDKRLGYVVSPDVYKR